MMAEELSRVGMKGSIKSVSGHVSVSYLSVLQGGMVSANGEQKIFLKSPSVDAIDEVYDYPFQSQVGIFFHSGADCDKANGWELGKEVLDTIR